MDRAKIKIGNIEFMAIKRILYPLCKEPFIRFPVRFNNNVKSWKENDTLWLLEILNCIQNGKVMTIIPISLPRYIKNDYFMDERHMIQVNEYRVSLADLPQKNLDGVEKILIEKISSN